MAGDTVVSFPVGTPFGRFAGTWALYFVRISCCMRCEIVVVSSHKNMCTTAVAHDSGCSFFKVLRSPPEFQPVYSIDLSEYFCRLLSHQLTAFSNPSINSGLFRTLLSLPPNSCSTASS